MARQPGEWSFTIEKNPKESGYHAHCLQRGPSIPQDELQEACEKAHAGIPYINAIRRKGKWTSLYGLKGFGADGYGLKAFRSNGSAREALRINNGRLEHHSRRFFTIDGDVFRVRDMESLAIAAMNGSNRKAFIGCAPEYASTVMKDVQLRNSLIRDVHRRQSMKLRCMR